MRGITVIFATFIAELLVGCVGDHSVLAPHGREATQIAILGWILFAGGAAVLAVVITAVAFARNGSDRLRLHLATERSVILGGIAFPAVILTGLLGYGILLQASVPPTSPGNDLRIDVVGEQWWWRVRYENAAGGGVASANEIRIPVGRRVEFSLRSADVIHSFWIPSLAGKVDMIPGRTTRLHITAERAGIFRGQCAEYCGGPHALMAFAVVAMPADEFDAWLMAHSAAASTPQSDIGRRGQDVFFTAGCGACHSIRGTPAQGIVGPDLTHFGARRSVGIDTMPMTLPNVAKFIADVQHIKPGNAMPPFRIFSDAERDALAVFLVGLR